MQTPTRLLSVLLFSGFLSAQTVTQLPVTGGFATLPFKAENQANKNAKGGYGGLNGDGLFPWGQICCVPQAGPFRAGILSSQDWTAFNAKQSALGIASATASGILSNSDWLTFNGKQASLGFTPENAGKKNMPFGYAGLGANGLVPPYLLPPPLPGPSGPRGLPGGISFVGAWNEASAYAASNVVSFKGSSYISLTDGNTGNQPDLTANWAVVAQGSQGSLATPVTVWNEVYLPDSLQPVFTLPHLNVLNVRAYRNGMRMALGNDFTILGNVVTFSVSQSPGPGDVVLFDYEYLP